MGARRGGHRPLGSTHGCCAPRRLESGRAGQRRSPHRRRGLRDRAGLAGGARPPVRCPRPVAWKREAAALGRPRALHVESVEDLALALRLAALFSMLPASEIPAGRQAATGSDPADLRTSGQLAKVRALLAKAEATTFADEAEALSAKAQELISKHSLEPLLQHEADRATDARPSMTYRRLWLDAPYVDAKASLVMRSPLPTGAERSMPNGWGTAPSLGYRRPRRGRPDADLPAGPGPTGDVAARVAQHRRAFTYTVVPPSFLVSFASTSASDYARWPTSRWRRRAAHPAARPPQSRFGGRRADRHHVPDPGREGHLGNQR